MGTNLTVETRAGTMAYQQAGAGDPVILIHGIPTNSGLWRNVMADLASDFAVYAPDMIGYGASDKPEDQDLSVGAQADYLVDFMDAVGIDAAHLVGHDIGGGVAQVFTVRNRDRVNKLVLVDSVAYDSWPEPGIARLKEPAWDEIMQRLDITKGFRKGLEQGMVQTDKITDEVVDRYADPFRDLDGRLAYLRAARALDNRDLLDIADEIEAIDKPVLILWGDSDIFQKVEYGRRLADALADARLVVIDGAGHFLPEDQPEVLAQHIRKFLVTLEARGQVSA
ncbi:MAG: alpha/beta fold hydrolase [Anaerolineae bacterium]